VARPLRRALCHVFSRVSSALTCWCSSACSFVTPWCYDIA
jgi:hypothetical protein